MCLIITIAASDGVFHFLIFHFFLTQPVFCIHSFIICRRANFRYTVDRASRAGLLSPCRKCKRGGRHSGHCTGCARRASPPDQDSSIARGDLSVPNRDGGGIILRRGGGVIFGGPPPPSKGPVSSGQGGASSFLWPSLDFQIRNSA